MSITQCAFCFSPKAAKQCTGCKGVVYCTVEHQKSDWKNHKTVCAKTKAVGPVRPIAVEVKDLPNKGKGYVATERIPAGTQIMHVKNLIKSDSYDKDLDPVPTAVVNGLVRRLLQKWDDKISGTATWRALHAVGVEKLTSPFPTFSDQDWSLARAQVLTNCFHTEDDKWGQVALCGAVSFFNHSCDPNAANSRLSDGTALVVAVKDIEAGEEVTISYSPEFFSLPVAQRKAKLLDVHHFECDCKVCASNDATRPYLTAQMTPGEDLKDLEAEFDRMTLMFDAGGGSAMQVATAAKQLLDKAVPKLGLNNWRLLELRKHYMDAMLMLYRAGPGLHKPALKQLLLDVMKSDEVVFPALHNARLPAPHMFATLIQEPLPDSVATVYPQLKYSYKLNPSIGVGGGEIVDYITELKISLK